MAITAITDILKRKREQPFIEGYFIDGVDDLTIGADTTDETIHVHGNSSAIAGTTVDNGNVSITILRENAAGQVLVQVITDNDPLLADNIDGLAKFLNWDNVRERNLWVNLMNEDQDTYLGGIFIPKWVAAVNGPAGAPNDRGRRTFTGRSEIPQEFTGVGVSISCELLESGTDVALRTHADSGTENRLIAANSGSFVGSPKYAIGVRGINSGSANSWVTEMLTLSSITAAMVDEFGNVDFAAIGAALSTEIQVGADNAPNYAMIYFLYSGAGVFPASGAGVDHVPDRLTRTNDPLRV